MVEEQVKFMKKENSDSIYFVAEYNGEVIGTMYFTGGHSYITKHIGEIHTVVTAEEYQRKGVCRALFNAIKEYAKSINVEIIYLTVRGWTDAGIVYQKLGFKKFGELPNGIKDNGRYYNEIYYYYNLD